MIVHETSDAGLLYDEMTRFAGFAERKGFIALDLASVTVLVVMQGLVKAASEEVPEGRAVFFRFAFALLVIVIWLKATGWGLCPTLPTRRP